MTIDYRLDGKGKTPFCMDYINEHDVRDSSRIYIHPPGTIGVGFVNDLGERSVRFVRSIITLIGRLKGVRLQVAEERDSQKRSVFPEFDTAECAICRRVCMDTFYWGLKYPSELLKRHIRQ